MVLQVDRSKNIGIHFASSLIFFVKNADNFMLTLTIPIDFEDSDGSFDS